MDHGGVVPPPASPYVGVDRRQPRLTRRDTITAAELAAFVVALVVVGGVLPTVLSRLRSDTAAVHALWSLQTLWSMLFVGAGMFRLVRWRLTGETRVGLTGCAVFCFGLLSGPSAVLAPLMSTDPRMRWLSPASRGIAVAACVLLLVRAMRAAPVDARIRPARVIATTVGAAWAVLMVLVLSGQRGHPVPLAGRAWLPFGLACTAAWLVLALLVVVVGVRHRQASAVWIGIGLLVLGVAEMLRSVALVEGHTIVFYAACLQLVVGGSELANAACDLGTVFSADGNRLLSLRSALWETEQQLTEEEQRRHERLHDARSVIAALKAASLTLDRYEERLDADVRHRLRTSVVSELDRLERVIDERRSEPLRPFRVDAALAPVLVAERANGLVVRTDLPPVRAQGRPLEFATVVQNLLVNARRHAPGSMVRVRAAVSAGTVQVFVEDDGPGVPATEHERVFERGYRTEAAGEGTGLGLYLARRLMREQSGEIVLRERAGGGASFVLSLAVAAPGSADGGGATVVTLPRQRCPVDVPPDAVPTHIGSGDVARRSMFVLRRPPALSWEGAAAEAR